MKKLITITGAVIFSLSIFAQAAMGDELLTLLGAKLESTAVKQFFAAYEIKNVVGYKYTSVKKGINVTAKGDVILSIDFYRNNPIYGQFLDELPKGLAFGLSPSEVTKKLGKATTSYMNSGYCEYSYAKVMLTCWFEDGQLTQVGLSLQ